MGALARTSEEIVRKIDELTGENDLLGARRDVLYSAIPEGPDRARLLRDGDPVALDGDELLKEAKGYIEFAVEKIVHHRGLSAVRSADKFLTWVWLLEPEKYAEIAVLQALPPERAGQYAANIIKESALALGLREEWDRVGMTLLSRGDMSLINMVSGKPCRPGCDEGCV